MDASTWSCLAHRVSGLVPATHSPYSDSLSLRLPLLYGLTLRSTLTRWFIMQKVRGQAFPIKDIALPPLVGTGFQNLFHSPFGVLFTFPSRYYALSVTCLYLVLDDGPPGFPQGFSSPMVLGILLELGLISLTGLSPSLAAFPKAFSY